MTSDSNAMFEFSHANKGLARFPPNVEQITVNRESTGVKWLTVRRNEVELKFPLEPDDCRHLASVLLAGL